LDSGGKFHGSMAGHDHDYQYHDNHKFNDHKFFLEFH
jgi:hypothetical protein